MNQPADDAGPPRGRRPSTVALLLLACPAMHLFHGHGGHRQHGTHDGTGADHGPRGG